MSTKWVVTTAGERIVLDDAKQGETTFTVTNPGPGADRAVFEAVPGEGADPAWFAVDEPQRRVLPAASVSFLLRTSVPDGAPPGSYEVQGRVYSADSAPEESSVLSGRVVFEVAAPPAPAKRRIPWWIVAVAAGLVVVTAVVVTLVVTLGGGTAPPAAVASASASPAPSSGPVAVPDLAQLNETQALFALKQAGLKAGKIRHRNDPAHPESVLEQAPAAKATAPAGSAVDLVIGVKLSVPNTPTTASRPSPGNLTIAWKQTEPYVTRWQVTVTVKVCVVGPGVGDCAYAPLITAYTTEPSYSVRLTTQKEFPVSTVRVFYNGSLTWRVAAIDDFDNVGAATGEISAFAAG